MTYAQSLSGWYVYEDLRTDTGHVYQASWAGWSSLLEPRGVTKASHAVTSLVFGAGPRAARSVSLVWHLVNGWLLWLVARRAVTPAAAVMATGLFLLLPIQTEAVASVAYRSELVVATALLLALWCAARGWWIPACLCALGAVAGKETGIMALALVPLWNWWTRTRAWTPTVAVYWLAASLTPLLLVFDHSRLLLWASLLDVGRSSAALIRLLALLVWPVGLAIDHDWAAITPLVCIAALIVLVAALESGWRRWPVAGFALTWTLLALLPRFVWQLGEGLHEHHLYIPVMAWSLAAGSLLFPKASIA